MSELTSNFEFILPAKGEFPGEWDEKLNFNFEQIDELLGSLNNSNAGEDEPIDAVNGSTWFATLTELLKIKTATGFVPVVAHTHDNTIEGVSKINLATEVSGKLLPANIEQTGLGADTLDGYHVNDLATRLAGAGLSEDSSNPAAKKIKLSSIVAPGTYSLITVDAYGRVTGAIAKDQGTGMYNLSDYSIGDVYTKTQVDSSFAPKIHLHDQAAKDAGGERYAVYTHNHDASYAQKAGDAAQTFLVASPTTGSHAVSRTYAQAQFAALLGLSTNYFDVKTILNPSSPSEVNDGYKAINLYFANARYSVLGHAHDYNELTGSHQHDGSYVKLDGSSLITGALNVSGGYSITELTHLITKGYLDGRLTTERSTSNSTYAPKAGLSTQKFEVKTPDISSSNKEAINIEYADSKYSTIHNHPYLTEETVVLEVSNQVDVKLEALNIGSIISATRQGIISRPTTLFTTSGLNITLKAESAFTFANGYNKLTGDKNVIYEVLTDRSNFWTVGDNTTTWIYLETALTDLKYYCNAASAGATQIQLNAISNYGIPVNKKNQGGFLKIDSTVYSYFETDPVGSPGLLDISPALTGNVSLNSTEIFIVSSSAGTTVLQADSLLGKTTTIEPVYSSTAPSGAYNKIWFDTNGGKSYWYSSPTWYNKKILVLSKVITSGGSITSIEDPKPGTVVPQYKAGFVNSAVENNIATFDAKGNIKDSGKSDLPCDIHGYYIGTPAINTTIFKFVAGRDCTIKSAQYGHVGTNPSSTTNFDIKVNGVSKSTMSVATNGVVTFTDNGLNSLAVTAGQYITIHAPSNLNGLADIGFNIPAKA